MAKRRHKRRKRSKRRKLGRRKMYEKLMRQGKVPYWVVQWYGKDEWDILRSTGYAPAARGTSRIKGPFKTKTEAIRAWHKALGGPHVH